MKHHHDYHLIILMRLVIFNVVDCERVKTHTNGIVLINKPAINYLAIVLYPIHEIKCKFYKISDSIIKLCEQTFSQIDSQNEVNYSKNSQVTWLQKKNFHVVSYNLFKKCNNIKLNRYEIK